MIKYKPTHTDALSPLLGRGFGGGSSFSPPSEGSGEALGFASLLIANRGEIAVRIIRAAQKNGIRSVAVYASDDADSLHVSLADEAILLPGNTLAETYLNQEKIILIALGLKVEAIHPGYGFLSENADFAQKVADAGLVFIGPTPENIRLMGEKNRALAYVGSLGIPILKSFHGSTHEILEHAPEMDFPVMVKASGGGGGKGMVICNSVEELLPALEKAERQALSYFGNGELFVEKYLPRARHIEVQLMADHHGNVLHFFERECSVQRRFQKIIEEAPSPSVDEKLREGLTSAAVSIARSMDYRNAGTIEFLLGENGKFYFLEMNTRIQVEHPVTEMITKTDLVSMQLQVASGSELSLKQEDIQISGHAIEARLCAEDAGNNFKPSAGKLEVWETSGNEFTRLETFVQEGLFVSANYDSLLAKVIVWGASRNEAISLMQTVFEKTNVLGVNTNLLFLEEITGSETFRNNELYTKYIDENLDEINRRIQDKKQQIDRNKVITAYLFHHFYPGIYSGASVWNQLGYWRMMPRLDVVFEGESYPVHVENTNAGMRVQVGQKKVDVALLHRAGKLLGLGIDGQKEVFYCTEKDNVTCILYQGFSFAVRSNAVRAEACVERKKSVIQQNFQNLICADLFGMVLNLNVTVGEEVRKEQVLLTLESMKTEIHVLSPANARIKQLHVIPGQSVAEKQLLVEIAPSPTLPRKGRDFA
jgi:acetyl/propionyl-CoA carboxylase alpha subunit